LTIWHCILSAELIKTQSFRQFFRDSFFFIFCTYYVLIVYKDYFRLFAQQK